MLQGRIGSKVHQCKSTTQRSACPFGHSSLLETIFELFFVLICSVKSFLFLVATWLLLGNHHRSMILYVAAADYSVLVL